MGLFALHTCDRRKVEGAEVLGDADMNRSYLTASLPPLWDLSGGSNVSRAFVAGHAQLAPPCTIIFCCGSHRLQDMLLLPVVEKESSEVPVASEVPVVVGKGRRSLTKRGGTVVNVAALTRVTVMNDSLSEMSVPFAARLAAAPTLFGRCLRLSKWPRTCGPVRPSFGPPMFCGNSIPSADICFRPSAILAR